MGDRFRGSGGNSEEGVKGFCIVWSSNTTILSSSLGVWMDFESSSGVFLVMGVVTSATTGGEGGSRGGSRRSFGVLVSLAWIVSGALGWG